MHRITRAGTRPEAAGLVIHGAAKYDFIVWLYTLGGERKMRERMLRLAQLQAGEHVLDMGCGAGTLAILAKRQVGETGLVYGVDASPEMIARAAQKAERSGLRLVLREGAAQALPIADASLDVVISTLMLHHVPKQARAQVASEIKRVLKPDGRFLAVDFMKPAARDRSVWSRFHRHGAIDLAEFATDLEMAGLHVAASAPLGEKNMHYLLATSGSPDTLPVGRDIEHARPRRSGARSLIAATLGLIILALLALHIGLLSELRLWLGGAFWFALAAALPVIVIVKIGLFRFAHLFSGRFLSRWLDAREEGSEQRRVGRLTSQFGRRPRNP